MRPTFRRPEWYFLFLFEFLKYFPGELEWVGAAVIPGLLILALMFLPLYDKNPHRHYSKRKFAIGFMSFIVLSMVVLTIKATITTPPQEETHVANTIAEKMALGEDIYSIQCVECHGADGEGGEIVGVEGLEGVVIKSISSSDEMYTPQCNDTLMSDYLLQDSQNFGHARPLAVHTAGELSPSEMRISLVTLRRRKPGRPENL